MKHLVNINSHQQELHNGKQANNTVRNLSILNPEEVYDIPGGVYSGHLCRSIPVNPGGNV